MSYRLELKYITIFILSMGYAILIGVLSLKGKYSIDFGDYFFVLLFSISMKYNKNYIIGLSENLFSYYFNWKFILLSSCVLIYIVARAGISFHFSPLIVLFVSFMVRVVIEALLLRREISSKADTKE